MPQRQKFDIMSFAFTHGYMVYSGDDFCKTACSEAIRSHDARCGCARAARRDLKWTPRLYDTRHRGAHNDLAFRRRSTCTQRHRHELRLAPSTCRTHDGRQRASARGTARLQRTPTWRRGTCAERAAEASSRACRCQWIDHIRRRAAHAPRHLMRNVLRQTSKRALLWMQSDM